MCTTVFWIFKCSKIYIQISQADKNVSQKKNNKNKTLALLNVRDMFKNINHVIKVVNVFFYSS